MIDRVREAAAGDPVRADEWNQLARLVNGWQADRWRSGPPGGAGDVRVSSGLSVLVRNDTGDDLPAFVPILLGETLTGIVATPDALPYESRDKPLFSGLECDGAGVHAVTQEAIPDGEIGRAVVMGVTVARVASGLVAGDMCQAPTSGNVELIAGGSYAKLLTDAVGSGDRVSLVLIGSGGGSEPAAVSRVRLTATGSSTAGAKSAARLTKRSGGTWVDLSGSGIDVWLVEPNGGILPDLTSGIAYHARDTGVSETVSSDTRRVYEAIVPPGLMTDTECIDGTQTDTLTPLGV